MNEKDAYIQQVNAKLKEWEAQIDLLKAKANSASADTRVNVQEEISELNTKKEKTQQQLIKLQHSGEDAWNELRNGLELAWKDLDKAMNNALARLKS